MNDYEMRDEQLNRMALASYDAWLCRQIDEGADIDDDPAEIVE